MAAGLTIPGSTLRLKGVGINQTRTGLLDTFREMGARIPEYDLRQEGKEPVADLGVTSQSLQGVHIHGDRVVRMIDEFPIFAVAATQAEGESIVRDASELRHKESDRISALVSELQKMGAQIEERDDGFVVSGPTRLQAAHVHSHGDHRLAMALTVAALLADGDSLIEGADVIQESYPDFKAHMTALGAEIK
jgi:3-phosphoshikimate 1-carboxyvinyltransferase